MKDQGLYHLLNSYKTKEEADQHLSKMKSDLQNMKILKVKVPKHNIKIEEFEKLWNEQGISID